MRFILIGLVVFKVVVADAQFAFPYYAGGASANTLLSSLVAYYALNEATAASNANDSSGNSLTLTRTADPTVGTGLLAGDRIGNGTSQLFSNSGVTNFNFGNSDFTICGFVNFASLSGSQTLWSRYNTTSNQRSYEAIVTSSLIRFTLSADGTAVLSITNSLTLSVSTWYFVAIRYNSGASIAYINVTPCSETTLRAWQSSSITGGAFATSTATFALMANASGAAFANWFNGQMDEVGIWNAAKSDADMEFNFNAGVPLGKANYH